MTSVTRATDHAVSAGRRRAGRRAWWLAGLAAAIAMVAVVVAVGAAAADTGGAPGDLDATFNPCAGGAGPLCDGLLASYVNPYDADEPYSPAHAVAVQPDGKIITAGAAATDSRAKWVLSRFHPDGRLDTSFGDGGSAVPEFEHETRLSTSRVRDVALQDDGKVVAVGSVRHDDHGSVFGVARFHADGQPDRGFGDGGTVTTHLDVLSVAHPRVAARAVAVGDDGDILVAGETRSRHSSLSYAPPAPPPPIPPRLPDLAAEPAEGRLVLARYDPSGELDPDFGDNGIATADFSNQGYTDARGYDLVVDNKRRVVIAGQARAPVGRERGTHIPNTERPPDAFGLVRFTETGELDATFGQQGRTVTPYNVRSASDLPRWRYVIADLQRWAVAARGVAIDDDGRIVAAGFASDRVAVARYSSGGQLDADFGDSAPAGGDVVSPLPGTVTTKGAHGHALGLQSDGRIVVAGDSTHDDAGVAVLRYHQDGALDDGFGDGGQVHTDVAVGDDAAGGASALALDGRGRLVVAGQTDGRMLVGRYLLLEPGEAPGAVAGTVSDAGDGEPVAGATVRVTDSQGEGLGTVESSGEGAYGLAGLEPGEYTVAVDHGDYAPAERPAAVPAGGTATVDVALEPTTGAVAGTITDGADGNAVADAEITVSDADGQPAGTVTTDGDGGYEVGGLAPGEYTVTADHEHYQPATNEATVEEGGTAMVDVALPRAARRPETAIPDPGELDPTFNPCDGVGPLCGGLLATYVNPDGLDEPYSPARAVAVQSDGKVVAAGQVHTTQENGRSAWDWLVTRRHPDGSLDASFGDGGVVVTDLAPQRGWSTSSVSDLAVGEDGAIVAAGTVRGDDHDAFAVARYHPDGSLDEEFGYGGTVVTDVDVGPPGTIATGATARAVAVDGDGGVLVAGVTERENTNLPAVHDPEMPKLRRATVVRYSDAGQLDATFGDGGVATADFAPLGYSDAGGYDLALDGQGRPVVVGRAKGGYAESRSDHGSAVDGPPEVFALARFTTGGELDGDFGGDGRVVTPFVAEPGAEAESGGSRWPRVVARGVAIDGDGRVVAAGEAAGELALARYTPDGRLDTAFGDSGEAGGQRQGMVTTPGARAFDVTLDPEGAILTVGHTTSEAAEIAVARHTADGRLDSDFGDGGQAVTPVAVDEGDDGGARAAALDGEGRLVAAGAVGHTGRTPGRDRKRLVLARYVAVEPDVGAVAGAVSDADSGEPVEGAEVTVTDGDGEPAGAAETGGFGGYAVRDLEPGAYTVVVEADGYEDASRDTTVEVGETTAEDVALEPTSGAVAGSVAEADSGDPVEGAEVAVTGEDGETAGSDQTDAEGGYAVADLQPATYTVTVEADGYESQSRETTVEGGETTEEDFALDGEVGAVAGTVADAESGEPVADAGVTVTGDGGEIAGGDRTGAEGGYEVAGLEPATYTVTVEADGYASESRQTTVKAGQTTTEDFALEGAAAEGGGDGDAEAGDGEENEDREGAEEDDGAGEDGAAEDGAAEDGEAGEGETGGDGSGADDDASGDTVAGSDAGADGDGEDDGAGEDDGGVGDGGAGGDDAEEEDAEGEDETVEAAETAEGDGASGGQDAGDAGVSRVAGASRFATAARLSQAAYPEGAEVGYVATGEGFADALAGGVAAGLERAPVLLTASSALPEPTAGELDRLDLERVVILGGEGAVAASVEAELAGYADEVDRLAGVSRFATAAAVARHAFPAGADTVYVASGEGFADALAGVSAAVDGEAPLLLAAADELTAPTAAELERLDPDRVVVLGGEAALARSVEAAAAAHADRVDRLAGPSRFATAAAIAVDGFDGAAGEVFTATGLDYPDALAAGAVAGARGAPVLLAAPDELTRPTRDAITTLQPAAARLLGGQAALSGTVEEQLRELLADR